MKTYRLFSRPIRTLEPAPTGAGSARLRLGTSLLGSGLGLMLMLMLLAALSSFALAAEPTPFMARAGLDIAEAGAKSWAPDAFLVYIENDEDLGTDGVTTRWGYLFYSPGLDRSRVYSIRDHKILVAENLEMKFEAPPLSSEWIDSPAAFEAAERHAGREFRRDQGGQLATMLLMRGAFHDEDPDQTTWTLIYTAPNAPSLFVVVDASQGKVRKTWRG
jgi:hypothetical protein